MPHNCDKHVSTLHGARSALKALTYDGNLERLPVTGISQNIEEQELTNEDRIFSTIIEDINYVFLPGRLHGHD